MTRAIRLKWARKILRAKNFMVLTDKESILALAGISPESINDIVMLHEQQAAIADFLDKLKDLLKAHEKRAIEITGGPSAKSKRLTGERVKRPRGRPKTESSSVAKPRKKIQVRQEES